MITFLSDLSSYLSFSISLSLSRTAGAHCCRILAKCCVTYQLCICCSCMYICVCVCEASARVSCAICCDYNFVKSQSCIFLWYTRAVVLVLAREAYLLPGCLSCLCLCPPLQTLSAARARLVVNSILALSVIVPLIVEVTTRPQLWHGAATLSERWG